MSLFNKNDIFDSVLTNLLYGNNASFGEKVEMLFTDVEAEGKDRGYKKAASEYEASYLRLKKHYSDTIAFIDEQKKTKGAQAYQFDDKLNELRKIRKDLEQQVNSKTNDVAKKYNIDVNVIRNPMTPATSIVSQNVPVDILGIVYSFKAKKLHQAELASYEETKAVYETKIQQLEEELNAAAEGCDGIQNLCDTIKAILNDIAEEEMKIAELKTLL